MIEVPSEHGRWAAGEAFPSVSDLGLAGVDSAELIHQGRRGPTLRARRSGGDVVAVKVGAALRTDRAGRRFLDEAAALRSLPASPHVVPILDAGVSADGHPWLVCPWREGGSHADRLALGPLPVEQVIEAGGQAAAGLAALHRAGLLHGNLTPANLLLDAYGDTAVDGMALASLAPAQGDHDRPPEVLEGGGWTVAGDVWSLGFCLHTMLTGRPPWARQSQQSVARLLLAMSTGEPPGTYPAGTPEWLEELLAGCLEADPAGRPAGADEVIARLDRRRQVLATILPPAPPAPPVQGRPLGSSYLLLEPIGAGASGQVWRAERRWDGAAVAVKVLRPELAQDPEAVARFLRERTTLVGLDDPHLVGVLDLVAEGTTLAIVMDLVKGPDLRRMLSDRGPLAPREACALLAQVAAALAAIHRVGVVHRDLKPENILVERPGTADATARVTDFGIARTAGGPAITRANQLAGTAEYLAPELVAGRALAPPADVYSLGVVAYELLCGRRPFEGEHLAAVLRPNWISSRPGRPGWPNRSGRPSVDAWPRIPTCGRQPR